MSLREDLSDLSDRVRLRFLAGDLVKSELVNDNHENIHKIVLTYFFDFSSSLLSLLLESRALDLELLEDSFFSSAFSLVFSLLFSETF